MNQFINCIMIFFKFILIFPSFVSGLHQQATCGHALTEGLSIYDLALSEKAQKFIIW